MRRCVARVNRNNAGISTIKQKSSHKGSAEVCSVFKMVACTSAILDLTFWRQNYNSLRLCHLVLMLITRVNNLVLKCLSLLRTNKSAFTVSVTVTATVIVVNVTEN